MIFYRHLSVESNPFTAENQTIRTVYAE